MNDHHIVFVVVIIIGLLTKRFGVGLEIGNMVGLKKGYRGPTTLHILTLGRLGESMTFFYQTQYKDCLLYFIWLRLDEFR